MHSLAQRRVLQEFHDQEVCGSFPSGLEHLDDAGMSQGAGELDLGPKVILEILFLEKLGPQHFDRNLFALLAVVGGENGSRATRTESTPELVAIGQ